MSEFSKSDYDLYPQTLAADDFWGQVRRTVNGKPVGQDQIDLIVESILAGLDLRQEDTVVDLACGNGALSRYFFARCSSLLGVDSSAYLISVAKDNFEVAPRYLFQRQDAAHYVASEANPGRFTKVLCYGSFPFFEADAARLVLQGLSERFRSVDRILLGNLPDRDRAASFYGNRSDYEAELDDPRAQIGIWRSREQMGELARSCGWQAEFSQMPPAFYARHYRYDVVLRR